ncbi:MAG TPA: hypothetical protein DGH68_01570, partial [Bacteroidetes bacterium]|nr:hypothetical protein [Bacteroidota bacterium]
LHYDDSLGHLPNGSVPDSVAIALYNASDHLPVLAKFIFQGGTQPSAEPTLQASNVGFNTVMSGSMGVTWTNGNGAYRIVVARAGGPVSFTPTDGQSYPANSNFALATDLGSGNKAVFSGSGNSIAVTGLASNTTYHFAVYEFNGSGGTENYLTTFPATNSQATLSVTYYSQGNLPPDILSSWNSERGGSGSPPANFTSGVPFVVQGGDSMTTTSTWSISGSGSALQIESGGTLTANHAITLASTAMFQIANGGTYIHNNTGVPASTVFQGVESFAGSSNVEIRGWVGSSTAIPIISGAWGNLKITYSPATAWNNLGNITSIQGSFTIDNNSTSGFRFVGNAPLTLTVEGDVNIVSGLLQISNAGSNPNTFTLNLGGSFNQTGGTFEPNVNTSSTLTINFKGSGKSFTKSAGTLVDNQIDWVVDSAASLTLMNGLTIGSSRSLTINGTITCGANAISGAGAVTVSSGAILDIGSVDGINSGTTLGNIRVSGSRTFDAGANYTLHGTAAQVMGNGFPATVNALSIINSNGVTLSGGVAVNGSLMLVDGALSIASNTLTLNGDT